MGRERAGGFVFDLISQVLVKSIMAANRFNGFGETAHRVLMMT
jgi:hypothetical protein